MRHLNKLDGAFLGHHKHNFGRFGIRDTLIFAVPRTEIVFPRQNLVYALDPYSTARRTGREFFLDTFGRVTKPSTKPVSLLESRSGVRSYHQCCFWTCPEGGELKEGKRDIQTPEKGDAEGDLTKLRLLCLCWWERIFNTAVILHQHQHQHQ